MPIYEYQCNDCGERYEEFIVNSNDRFTLYDCPKCLSVNIRRIFSVFGFNIDGKFHHSEGYVKPDRDGYHPEIDDPPTEIKADLKRLEESKVRINDPTKYKKINQAIKDFQFVYKDVL